MKYAALIMCALVAAGAGCGDDRGRAARDQYNQGVAHLAAGELDQAAKALLAARNDAGFDDEVRFRAAFNLAAVAVARADQAMAEQPPKADQAVAAYEQARGWLSDAVRRRPDDAEARANLERVEARLLALIDQAGQGENSLERRLDRAIAAERGLRDTARALWSGQATDGGDPLAARDEFEAAATRQRTLTAEVGVIADLAGDEITAIGGKAEDQRTDEEKVRLVQLQNLDLYVEDARKAMTDARRNLHELAGELAHGRTAAALESLKRGREQLLDPVAVLQGVAGDEVQLARYLGALAGWKPEQGPTPAWLTTTGMGGEQIDLRARLEEVKARLAAALAAPAPSGDPGTGGDPAAAAPAAAGDPKAAAAAKVRAQVAAAMPAVEAAAMAMKRAADALGADDLAGGAAGAHDAVAALALAIEQFLALRQVIDVTLAEQRAMIAGITPPADGAAATMSAQERAALIDDGLAKNRARLARLQGMIADELAKATAPSGDAAGGAAPAPAPDPAQLEQMKAMYAQAETLRGQADAALAAMAQAVAGGKGPAPLASAQEAEARLVELQQLFFSVIEHLKDLIAKQGETRDDTVTAQTEDDAGRAARLPGLIDREGQHGQLAEAIAKALAAQADAANQQAANPQGGPAPRGGPTPEALGQAAQEVRAATTSMQDASTTLAQARDQSQQMSFDMNPALDAQQAALDHLESALRLLQPPQQQDQDQKQDQQKQDQQKQDQQKQDQQKQDQQKQDQQQQSADQQLQQVREREAQRERDKRDKERQRAGNEPVDKDW